MSSIVQQVRSDRIDIRSPSLALLSTGWLLSPLFASFHCALRQSSGRELIANTPAFCA